MKPTTLAGLLLVPFLAACGLESPASESAPRSSPQPAERVAATPPAIVEQAEQVPEREVFRVGGKVDAPVVLNKVQPDLTHIQLDVDAKPRGVVIVEAVIDEAGLVESARVLKSSDVPEIDEAVLAALGQWTFEPATRDGEPVAAYYTANINIDTR